MEEKYIEKLEISWKIGGETLKATLSLRKQVLSLTRQVHVSLGGSHQRIIIEGLPAPVLDALRFEKSNWAVGSVLDDPFYQCQHLAAQATPGTLLRTREGYEYRCIADSRRIYLV